MSGDDKINQILITLGKVTTDIEWIKKELSKPPVVSLNDVSIPTKWYVVSILAIIAYFASLFGTYHTLADTVQETVDKGMANVKDQVQTLSSKLDSHLEKNHYLPGDYP